MLPAFRLGAGGVIGSGEQYFSWIHIDDLIHLLVRGLSDRNFSGPFNATAPVPVTNREFTKALGKALRRPTMVPVPAFALKLALGEAAVTLLGGQRVIPAQATEWGYDFAFTTIDAALTDIIEPS